MAAAEPRIDLGDRRAFGTVTQTRTSQQYTESRDRPRGVALPHCGPPWRGRHGSRMAAGTRLRRPAGPAMRASHVSCNIRAEKFFVFI